MKGRSSKSSFSSTGAKSSSVRVKGQKKGWGFGEALFGIFLIWTAIPMIWMNERKDVKIYKVIVAGRKAVVEANCEEPSEELMMKLVHVKGETTTEAQVSDEMFGLVYDGTIKIKREVEVFQWVEESHEEGDSKVYTYTK